MTATVSLSIEIELGWGMNTSEKFDSRLSPSRSAEDRSFNRLLSICESSRIPISFNIVGHLLLESCSGQHDGPHELDPLRNDPGTDAQSDPLFYAPDMLHKLVEADVDHEFSRHTFSHIDCEQKEPSVLDWEFSRSNKEYDKLGISRPVSFVPPWHRRCSRNVLHSHGIRNLRVPFADISPTEPRFLWFMGKRRHPIRPPKLVDGIVETYSTSYPSLTTPLFANGQDDAHWHYRTVPAFIRRRIHLRFLKRTVEQAIEADSHVHHWTHLWNMANDDQLALVEPFFRYLAEQRDRGRIEILTMDQLGKRVRNNQ